MLHAQPAFALVLALVDKSQLVSLLPFPSPCPLPPAGPSPPRLVVCPTQKNSLPSLQAWSPPACLRLPAAAARLSLHPILQAQARH